MAGIGAIVNPEAGGWRRLRDSGEAGRDPAASVARWLAPDRPESVLVLETREAGDGAALARAAAALGCSTVVAVGGDGTINEILQGLCSMSEDARPPLGLIPMGTANVLARTLGLPLDPVEAGRTVRACSASPIDLGRANERWFALMAGIGFDARVTQVVDRQLKRSFGEAAYVLAALETACTYPCHPITLALDDGAPQEMDAYMVLVANAGCYGGDFTLGPDVRMDDGLLDVFVCLRGGSLALSLVVDMLALLQSRLHAAHGVRHFRARRVILEAQRSLPVQLDGDPCSVTPLRVEIVPRALRVLGRSRS